jgi:hypothetical protein
MIHECLICHKIFKGVPKRKYCGFECSGISRMIDVSSSHKGGAVHIFMKRRIPRPEFCEICGINPPKDLANKGHKYNTRNHKDWFWLCKKCHSHYDERDKKLIHFTSERQTGSKNTYAKLDEKKVLEIRKRYKNGELLRLIAPEYGVHFHHLQAIVARKCWTHI